MNSTLLPQQCTTQPNPDIIGVGIRISLYILSLAGPLIGFIVNSPEFTAAVDTSLGVTGLALFLTTVILTSKGSIDLFHAICVFHLLGLVGISVTPKSSSKSPKHISSTRYWAFTALYFVALVGSLSFLIYVFANASTFGSNPGCNAGIKYVLFGINVSATNNVIRWILVVTFAFSLFAYLMAILIGAGILCCCSDRLESTFSAVEGSEEPKGRKPIWTIAGHEIGCVYVIVMLELIIKRNNLGDGISDWTFGQILSMMMLIGPVIELSSSMLGEKDDEE